MRLMKPVLQLNLMLICVIITLEIYFCKFWLKKMSIIKSSNCSLTLSDYISYKN